MEVIKINNWEVINKTPFRKYGRYYVKVKCTCGSNIEYDLPKHHLISKKSKGCKKCSRFHTSKGYGLISGEYWSHVKSGASKRNIDFNLTIEDVWELYQLQNGKCNLTGIEIVFEPNCVHNKKIDNRKIRTCSLDRIDSTLGYVISNVQWVHKNVNLMKNKFNQEYFLEICELICKNKLILK